MFINLHIIERMTTLKKNTLKTIIALFLLALIGSPLTAMAQEGATSDAVIYPASYQLNSMDSVALADFYEYNMGMTILEEAD